MGKYEWAIIEVVVLGWLVWELVKVRRSIAKDREGKE